VLGARKCRVAVIDCVLLLYPDWFSPRIYSCRTLIVIDNMAATLQTSKLATPSSSTCQKRKRADFDAQPPTPPLTASDPEGTRLVSRGVNVLSTAAAALSQVTLLYESDSVAQDGLLRSVATVTSAVEAGGKLLICGVGKSGLVGRKMVATMKSLGIACSFMHAAEALHGDLGDIRKVRASFSLAVWPSGCA
jgi:hypothetical protein